MRKLPSELSLGLLLGMMAMNKSSLWVLALVLHAGLSHAGYHSTSPVKSKHGYVMARAQVLDESGQPILVEYDSSGKEVRALSLPIPTNQAILLPAAEYRQQQAQLDQYRQQHKDDLAKDALLLSSAQYAGMTFLAADNKTTIPAPPLPASVRSVLVRGQGNRLLASPAQLILLPFSVDLSQGLTIGDQITTLVMDRQGKLLDQVKGTVAPRSGFVADSNGKVLAQDMGQFQGSNATPIGPIRDAIVNTGDAFPGAGVSNEKGRYSFTFVLPPCPVGGFSFTTDVWLKMSYQSFTPRGGAILPYYMRLPGYDSCYASLHNPTSLVSAMAEVSDIATIATLSNVSYESNFYVDVMFLSGQVSLANPDGKPIPVADSTSYRMDPANADPVTQNYYDFDGDNKPDASVLGNIKTVKGDDGVEREEFVSKLEPGEKAKYQGVYFSSRSDKSGAPDLLRLADSKQNKNSNGLLASISKSDLQNTDILVFRESTGELVLSRQGVTNAELSGLLRDTGINGQNDHFYYRLMLRGPADLNWNMGGSGDRSGSWQQWASSNNMTEPYQKKAANHLKSGERVKVVAINRATGYMASQSVQLKDSSSLGSGLLSLAVPDMVLMPPNLKIWAERDYKVEEGMTQGEQRHYLIGSEGASLTSDNAITVYTEWLDQYGRPLPAGLAADNGEQYGLTGRLAKVVAPDLLQAVSDGQLASFPIPPGRSTQIVQIADNLTKPEHYYVHVAGTPKDNNPQFDAGSASAPLNSRPAKLTPFLTPFYDEDLSWVEFNAYRQLQSSYEQADDQSQLIKPIKPKSSYQWTYRPEYQFSRYQLEMNKLTVDADENGGTRVENLLDVKQPTLSSLDDLLTLFYSLNGPANPRLQSLDAGQDLVFALGESELSANIKSDGTIRFDKASLEHLSALQPEDFLSLKLYSNQDAGNVLWEYAFEYLFVDAASAEYSLNSEKIHYISADDPVVPLYALMAGYSERAASKKTPPFTLKWEVAGFGALDSYIGALSDSGVYNNQLTLPPTAHARAMVKISSLNDSSVDIKLAPIEVVPGKPAVISDERRGQISVGGADEIEITFTAKDAHNNYVPEGTPITFYTADNILMVDSDASIGMAGRASLSLKGGDFSGESALRVNVGGYEQSFTVNVQPINIDLKVDNVIEPGNSKRVDISVTRQDGSPVQYVAVDVNTTRGYLQRNRLVTDKNGHAETYFTAPDGDFSGDVVARVGYESSVRSKVGGQGKPKAVAANYTMLVGDKSTEGSTPFTRLDGSVVDLDYPVRAELSVSGQPGETKTITVGDLRDPAIQTVAAYYMNGLSDGAELDENGRTSLQAEYVSAVHDTAEGQGISYGFVTANDTAFGDKPSQLHASAVPELGKISDFGFNLDIKPRSFGGEIINLGNGNKLTLLADGRLQYNVRTDEQDYSVFSSPITLNQWHWLSARYHEGRIELTVDGKRTYLDASGDIKYDSSAPELTVGKGFTGNLKRLKWFDWQRQPLVTFANGTTTASVTLDGVGKGKVTLISSGRMNEDDSSLALQRIALNCDYERQYIGVLSSAGFEKIGGMYANYMPTNLPPLDMAAIGQPTSLWDQPQSQRLLARAIPAAHAGWFTDVLWEGVNFLLPLESIGIIVDQIGYLANGEMDKFDPVSLALASIDVLTVFPIAKPLKAVTIPARKLIRVMNKINPKFTRYFAAFIGEIAKRVKDGNVDSIKQILPFFVAAVEMYNDPEMDGAVQFILKTVNGSDDLFAWVDYLSLPVDGWDGDKLPQMEIVYHYKSSSNNEFVSEFDAAYAGANKTKVMKEFVRLVGPMLKQIASSVSEKEIKSTGQALRILVQAAKENPELRKKLFSAATLKLAISFTTRIGAKSVKNFVKGIKNARYSRPQLVLGLSYLLWESACTEMKNNPDRLKDMKCGDPKVLFNDHIVQVIATKMAIILGDSADKLWSEEDPEIDNDNIINLNISGHGAAFHLMQLAYYQALARAGGDKVKDSEAGRKVTFPTVGNRDSDDSILERVKSINNNKIAEKVGIPFQRYVDILLVHDQGEEKLERWVELKSYKASNRKFGLWSYPKGSAGKMHKQMLVDWVATRFGYAITTGDNAEGRVQVAKTVCPGLSNGSVWRFQRFKKSGVEPTPSLDVGAFNQTGSAVWLAAQTPKSGMDVHPRDIIFEKAPQAGNKCMGQRVVSANFKEFVTELTKIGLDYMIDNKDELMNALGEFE